MLSLSVCFKVLFGLVFYNLGPRDRYSYKLWKYSAVENVVNDNLLVNEIESNII